MDTRKFAFTIRAMTDEPCTQEDRNKIVAAAKKRVFEIYTLADELDSYGWDIMWLGNESDIRAAVLHAAAHLRQLIES